jgi:hypothetical protein
MAAQARIKMATDRIMEGRIMGCGQCGFWGSSKEGRRWRLNYAAFEPWRL